ncbi:hypothetical protein MCHI_002564 [Candidatus Magnetoovum chiemensis]|nr:hypothetical protein MCHI_002564 [Candidatus Magnetoovum chiemensis]
MKQLNVFLLILFLLLPSGVLADGGWPLGLDIEIAASDVNWSDIQNFPTGCTNTFVTAVDDTLTCAAVDISSTTNLGVTAIGLELSGDNIALSAGYILPTNPIPPVNGGTGTANGSNNTITFTGNYALGFTLSGATALTLPTSGTILTSAGSYSDPTWLTSLAKSKVGLSAVEDTALSTWAGSSNITTIGNATATGLSVSDANITNVGDIAVDSISADASAVNVNLGSSAGNNFTVDIDKFVVKGDTGGVCIGCADTVYPLELYGTSGLMRMVITSKQDSTGATASYLLQQKSANDNVDTALTGIAHASERTTQRYGITLGGWSEVAAGTDATTNTNGLIIGVYDNKPIVFGQNNIERMRITATGVGIGVTPTSSLHVEGVSGKQITVRNTGNDSTALVLDSNRLAAGSQLGAVIFAWNGTQLSSISGIAGADTTNKDDAELLFKVTDNGSSIEAIRISQTGIANVYYGVKIGDNSTNNLIDDASNGTGSAALYIGNASIDVTAPSDEAAKENIEETASSLTKIAALRVVDFRYKPEYSSDNATKTGLIAQEVAAVLPEVVNDFNVAEVKDSDGNIVKSAETLKYVQYKELIPYLVKAIQELNAKVDALENKEAALGK